MPWQAKRGPVLPILRIEKRFIAGKMRPVKICPPRPAQGAWFEEGRQHLTHREMRVGPHQ